IYIKGGTFVMAGGGLTPSSSASGIFFQGGGDDESQGGGGGGFMNSHFTSSYGNSSNPGCDANSGGEEGSLVAVRICSAAPASITSLTCVYPRRRCHSPLPRSPTGPPSCSGRPLLTTIPEEGSIGYWRKFVNEYFSPRAKKRWCLSHYDNVGHNTLGVSPQAATDEWQCDLVVLNQEEDLVSFQKATFDVLPRLNEIKFASGVIDELLYLSVPSERRFPSGIMVLEYAKAVQENFSVEFCTRRHEELLPRRLVAPQVNQLLQVAEKCQSTIDQSGPDGIHQQDLQANSNIMKDMIDFCRDQKVEALKSYPYRMRTGKMQMQEMEQVANAAQGLPPDRNSLNKLMALRNNNNMNGQGSAQAAAFALTNSDHANEQNQEQTQRHAPARFIKKMSPSLATKGLVLCWVVFLHICLLRAKCQAHSYNSSPHQQYQKTNNLRCRQ
ncbi:hypothetical protein HID58_093595, partial [Brassica napus]